MITANGLREVLERMSDAIKPACAICGKPAVRPYRVACGPEHSKERVRLKRNEKQRRWRLSNPAYQQEYMREWCGDNPEKRQQSWQKYYDANREQINAKRRAKRLNGEVPLPSHQRVHLEKHQ